MPVLKNARDEKFLQATVKGKTINSQLVSQLTSMSCNSIKYGVM